MYFASSARTKISGEKCTKDLQISSKYKENFYCLVPPGLGLNNLRSIKISFPENIQKLGSMFQDCYVVLPNFSY